MENGEVCGRNLHSSSLIIINRLTFTGTVTTAATSTTSKFLHQSAVRVVVDSALSLTGERVSDCFVLRLCEMDARAFGLSLIYIRESTVSLNVMCIKIKLLGGDWIGMVEVQIWKTHKSFWRRFRFSVARKLSISRSLHSLKKKLNKSALYDLSVLVITFFCYFT